MPPDHPIGTEPGIAAKVAFLRRPDSYPDCPAQVRVVETHMSLVFLTDHHAYKLKKPVRYEFLDFSTVEARRRDCEEEVRLNRRLAPSVYLEVLPLTLAGQGLRLGGQGNPVDWLVKMRRLPGSRMLDHLIRSGTATAGDVRPAVALLARFYRSAPVALTDPQAYLERLDKDLRDNAAELAAPRYGLPAERIAKVLDRQTALLAREPELFRQRVREGRIVEGHGDLRPEHICLEEAPVIIDCLEFNHDFRILDCADDLAFLALECERLGGAPLAHTVFDLYREMSGDLVPEKLVTFYKSCRACLRAKLALWHLRDGESADWTKWPAVARNYLALAEKYAARLEPTPPATG